MDADKFIESDDVRFERDSAWYVARPVTVRKSGYVTVAAAASKLSFEDAAGLLRTMLELGADK